MTTDKIAFFCNVLVRAPQLDLTALIAEVDHFGLSLNAITVGDILAAADRAGRAIKLKELAELNKQGFEAFAGEMRIKAEVQQRASRQREPATDKDADAIVLEALREAGGANDWVLAQNVHATVDRQTRRMALHRLVAAGLVERRGKARGANYRIKPVVLSSTDKPNGSVVVRKAKTKKIAPPKAQA